MVGGAIRMVISMAAYGASASAVRGVAKYSSGALRKGVEWYAKRAAKTTPLFLKEGTRESLLRAVSDRNINSTKRLIQEQASGLRRRIEARTSARMYRTLTRAGQAARDEVLMLPANYTFYRIERHNAVTPEQKEETSNFAKYYFGAPMMTSMLFSAALNRPQMVRKTAMRIGKMIPKTALKKVVSGGASVIEAASHVADLGAAASLARNRLTEKQGLLSLMATRNPLKLARDFRSNFSAELSRVRQTRTRFGYTDAVSQSAAFHADVLKKAEIGRKIQKKGRGGLGAQTSDMYEAKVRQIAEKGSDEILRSYQEKAGKTGRVQGFLNDMIENLDGTKNFITKTTATVRTKGGQVTLTKGPGLYTIGGRDYDFGRLSVEGMRDFMIGKAQRGIPGFVTRLFGVQDMLKYKTTEHSLGSAFGRSGEAKLIIPKSYLPDEGSPDGALDVMMKMIGAGPKMDPAVADAFLGSRIAAVSSRPEMKGASDSFKKRVLMEEASRGVMPLRPDDRILHTATGDLYMMTDLKLGGKSTPKMFQLGGTGEGEYMKFLKFTTADNLITRVIRNYMGSRVMDVPGTDKTVQVGPYPQGQVIENRMDSEGMIARLKRSLDIGFSHGQSAFSKIANVFRKHSDPNYGPTFFSEHFAGSPRFIDEIATNPATLKDVVDLLGTESRQAMDSFWAGAKQRMGTTDAVEFFSDCYRKGYFLHDPGKFMVSPTQRLGKMSPQEDIGVAKAKMEDFLDVLVKMDADNQGIRRHLDSDIREVKRIIDLFHEGSSKNLMDIVGVTRADRPVYIGGRRRQSTALDVYNSTVLRVMMSAQDRVSIAVTGEMPRADAYMDRLTGITRELTGAIVGPKERSAFVAGSHLSKMYHDLSSEFSQMSGDMTEELWQGSANRIREIMTSMTGSSSSYRKDILDYYRTGLRNKPYAWWGHDSRLKMESPSIREVYAIPAARGDGIIRTRRDAEGYEIADGIMDSLNITTMTMFNAFNRTASEMLGIGFDESVTNTPGKYLTKMLTKRIAPFIGAYMGYSVVDRMADRYLDGTPFGEGLTVFGANVLAGARVAAQGMLDVTGGTDAASYMEDLMPGFISSPASGLIRGLGPVAAGLSIGMKALGPRGALHGGIIGAGVGLLLGGGPLGMFGCIPANELIRTDNGFKPIGTITTDDLVYTCEGRLRKVLGVKESPIADVLRIELNGTPIPFHATPNHGILVKKNQQIGWTDVGSIDKGDYIAFPAKRRRTIQNIDLLWFLSHSEMTLLVDGEGNRRNISLLERTGNKSDAVILKVSTDLKWSGIVWPNAKLGTFIGWYLAEGSQMSAVKPTGVSLAISSTEREHVLAVIDDASSYLPFGKITYSESSGPHGLSSSIDISGSVIASILKGISYPAGSNCCSERKFIHPLLQEVSSDAFLLGLIGGLLDGDGDVETVAGTDVLKYAKISTTSLDLAWDVQKILGEFGILASVRAYKNYLNGERKKDKIHIIIASGKYLSLLHAKCSPYSYKLSQCTPPEDKQTGGRSNTDLYFHLHEGYIFRRVKEISQVTGTAPVYDLEVEEDSTFLGFGVTFHNSWDISKNRREVIEELTGEQEIAVRKGRWWELNSTPFEGSRVEYFRPHIYALTRSKYKETPVFKDTLFTDLVGTIYPDIYGIKDYYSRPYPVTAGLFANVPVFSSMLQMMPGSSMLTGAGIQMHEDEYSPSYMKGLAEDQGLNSRSISQMLHGGTGMFAQTGGRSDFDFNTKAYLGENPLAPSSAEYALGETVEGLKDIVGLRGFILGTGFERLTGERSLFESAPQMATPADAAGFRREYWDLELGGLAGTSEIIRRFIQPRRNQIQMFNPVRNCLTGSTEIVLAQGGTKPIQDLVPGEKIISSEGIRSVMAIATRNHKGTIISPKVAVWDEKPSWFTPDHMVLAIRAKYCHDHPERGTICHPARRTKKCSTCGYNDFNELRYNTHMHHFDYKPTWVKVSNLSDTDYLLYPIRKTSGNVPSIDTSFTKASKRRHLLPSTIPLDYSFGYLCGLYLSEGSSSSRGFVTKFALHVDEKDTLGQEILRIASTYCNITGGFDEPKRGNGLSVILHSKAFNLLMLSMFGKGSGTKYIEQWILDSAPPEFLLGLLHGHFEGDGTIRSNRPSSKTKSARLAKDLFEVGLQFGIVQSLHVSTDRCHMLSWSVSDNGIKTLYDLFNKNYGYKIRDFLDRKDDFNTKTNSVSMWFFHDNCKYLALKVEYLRYKEYDGSVYDIIIRESEHCFCVDNFIVHNSMPSWLPGKDYYVDFQHGDPFAAPVTMGEARLPGSGYETLHNVDLTFPIEGDMIGEDRQSQLAYWLGFPEYMAARNRSEDAAKAVAEEIAADASEYGEVIRRNPAVYSARHDIHATADALIRSASGERMALKVVPRGFAGESSINAFMALADVDTGMLVEVDPESGSMGKKIVKRDLKRFQADLSRSMESRIYSYAQVQKMEDEGKAMNLANAYSWFDRYRILADVAMYSKEYREADSIMQQQLQAGNLSNMQLGEYNRIQDQVLQKEKAYDFSEYRFLEMGESLTPYGKAKDAFYRNEYDSMERTVGAAWERITHLRNPVQTKMFHNATALEEYETNIIFGKQMKQWQRPVDDYLKSYAYQFMNESDPLQGALSGLTGGFLLGGTPLAGMAALIGAGIGTTNSLTGNVFVPDRVEARREVEGQLDAVKYAKYKKLYAETGDPAWALKAGRTMTGAAEAGKILDVKSAARLSGQTEKYYVEDIINNVTSSNVGRVSQILPGAALPTLYAATGQTDRAAGAMENLYAEQMNRTLPGAESSIYDPNVDETSPMIRTMQQEGLDAHDAGFGWYDQMAKLRRAEKMELYGGESLYGTMESKVGMREVNKSLSALGNVRQALQTYAVHIDVVEDGADTVTLDVIVRT